MFYLWFQNAFTVYITTASHPHAVVSKGPSLCIFHHLEQVAMSRSCTALEDMLQEGTGGREDTAFKDKDGGEKGASLSLILLLICTLIGSVQY
jgi:hypothetical protein